MKEEITEEFARELKAISDAHIKKYGFRKMTLHELDRLCGIRKRKKR